tara:strand:+ start:255 stop:467 length:213 start_codon:yes stop_codon:yes gene_type:complete
MFLANAIAEVNKQLDTAYKVQIQQVPLAKVYAVYLQYFTKDITVSEAAENIHGILVDTGLIDLDSNWSKL